MRSYLGLSKQHWGTLLIWLVAGGGVGYGGELGAGYLELSLPFFGFEAEGFVIVGGGDEAVAGCEGAALGVAQRHGVVAGVATEANGDGLVAMLLDKLGDGC